MTFHGHIENGLVVFDAAPGLPDGTPVVVTVAEKSVVEKTEPTPAKDAERKVPTLYERLKPIIGIAEGLPEDASVNIKHYLYGHPKK